MNARVPTRRIARELSVGTALFFGLACAPDVQHKPAALDVAPTHACGDELKLTGRVVDAAGVLPAAARARITTKLAGWEARTRHQFVVVTTPSLGGSEVALYSVRLFRRWGIGRKGANDGIGLLVAPRDHRLRIEVGRGLERVLPDDVAARINREVAIPRFQAGDLAGGVEAAVAAVIVAVDSAERGHAQRPH